MTATQDMMQALRRSHCDDNEREGPCVGVLTVDGEGFRMGCKLCGGATTRIAPEQESHGVQLARPILRAAGLDWDSLSPAAQLGATKEALRMRCYHCGVDHPRNPLGSWLNKRLQCGCGAEWSDYTGWISWDEAKARREQVANMVAGRG